MTRITKPSEVKREWIVLDAKDEIFELKYDRPDERIGMRIKLRSEAINEL